MDCILGRRQTGEEDYPKPAVACNETCGHTNFKSITQTFGLADEPATHFSFLQADITNATLMDCPDKCGDVDIHYPFGIGEGCYLPGFEVICDQGTLYLPGSNIQLLDILEGQVRVNSTKFIGKFCAAGRGGEDVSVGIQLDADSPFTFSASSNSFIAVGCNAAGMVTDNRMTLSQCVSKCFPGKKKDDGHCTGHGCCQTSIPAVKDTVYLSIGRISSNWSLLSVAECSYGFIVEDGGYSFNVSHLKKFDEVADIAMRLDWVVGGSSCEVAAQKGGYACRERSVCVNGNRGSGYLCKCCGGFQGNPYLNGSRGCQDINECLNSTICVPQATCKNKTPGFKCVCPAGSSGDGLIHGSGCTKSFPILRVVLGVGLSILILLVGSSWLYWALKKKRLINLKVKFFKENGGLLLQSKLSTHDGKRTNSTRIFSSEELEKATNNYDECRIIGRGGHGTVYKGILEDQREVAIKKSKLMDKNQIAQFINEVVILTQINHRNVVKLLGCCLETGVPLLVYEFVQNGTLHHCIHTNDSYGKKMTWKDRLRIATEVAEALAYLHSSASTPIFHRDVKSSNILLDDKYTAKVSDFGLSRLVKLDQDEITTMVKGTLGYLDPEYFYTSQLTAKSDVYSFGVVLVELLTGQKPISFDRSSEFTNLVIYFLSSLKTKKLAEILEGHIVKEDSMDEGEKRPTMKEVAQELALLKDFKPQSPEDFEQQSRYMIFWDDASPSDEGDWDAEPFLVE
ncbi:hypothetical protein ACLOJK_038898 [Asimina triloba]